MRVFLAFPAPAAVKQYAVGLQNRLCDMGLRGKWVRAANMHLTVFFGGEQEPDPVREFARLLEAPLATASQFCLNVGGLGSFGRPPRVLYLAWEGAGSASFAAVAATVRECAAGSDLVVPAKVMKQSVRPHLTLARFRGRREARALRRLGPRQDSGRWPCREPLPVPPPEAQSWCCERIVLFESVLRPEGAEYRELKVFELKAGSS